jgi:uroporphyrin-III C-methyltransferase / precorrin-2 dehydrogenase / sirohydrochlorin ferrochelatase
MSHDHSSSSHRKPVPEAPASPVARIGELASLPLFFKLRGKKVCLIGSSEAVAWKTELLAATGAQVHVFAPDPCSRLSEQAERENVTLFTRQWQRDDLQNVILAIADCGDEDEARLFYETAHAAGCGVVNVIDRPQWCDVQFGAIVERSPLVIGISTDGAAPVFGQMIRARIETLIPEGFRRWAQAARAWRARVSERNLSFRQRRLFWEGFSARALARPQDLPQLSDCDDLLALLDQSNHHSGRVALVGAGPGDPELLTMRAVRALQSADVILYDDLVSPHTLALGRREAERIAVGKRGYKPSCTQEDITALLIELAQQGKYVVRLKGGDPMIFGRAGEEIAALKAHNIPVDIIAGVTAATAAAAFLQTSLTERSLARRVQFITAHARNGRLPDDLDWHALTDAGATTVVYMGVRTLPLFVDKVLAHGLPPNTSAAVVERASWPDQNVIYGAIGDLPALVAAAKPAGPCLIIIGSVLNEARTGEDTGKSDARF